MAQPTPEALKFLEGLTAYIAWRGNNKMPKGFQPAYAEPFSRYIAQCGVPAGTPLHQALVDHMESLERAGTVPTTPPPPPPA